MKKIREMLENSILIKYFAISICVSFLLELSIFNYSTWRSVGLNGVSLEENIVTDETGKFEISRDIEPTDVRNFRIEGLELINCDRANVNILVADEGDAYQYELPTFRVIDRVASTGFVNIYPYGEVNKITVEINVPEGGTARAAALRYNIYRPLDIRVVRILIVSIIIWLFITFWKKSDEKIILYNREKKDQDVSTVEVNDSHKPRAFRHLARNDKMQTVVIILSIVALLIIGKWLSTSNEKIVSCPWPHHRQYQELAIALENGSVKLTDKEVSPELLAKDNPYDTGALLAEEIPYQMDYAYYDGSYYVYFGIVAELLLYYPFYKITGRQLSNYNSQYLLYCVLIIGIFLAIREMCFRFGRDEEECNKSRVSFITYLVLCFAMSLLSNNIYLISRADIYNIPIMAATSFTWFGIFFWLRSFVYEEKAGVRRLCICLGSLSMALVAGCRPQMIIFSLVAVVLFLICRDKDSSRLSIRNRKIFTKETLADTICLCVPYIAVAILVCWYNYARFGSILDFGATYSLTSNDMNHRGFNLDRLMKGLFAFFVQPAVLSMDFPYLKSSIVTSDYMGKNLTEFVFGGCIFTNIFFLSIFAPLFTGLKKFSDEVRAIFFILIAGVIAVAAFDVNGAGILYRYTCDFVPGICLASLIIWITLISQESQKNSKDIMIVEKLMIICVIAGLAYSFLVFMGPSGSICLKEDSIVLYEHIREFFRL